MSNTYRETAVTCPGCDAMMESSPIEDAVIDHCLECAGIWVDWFDGDLPGVIRQVSAARGPRAPGRGSGSCPRCQRPLEGEHVSGSVGYGIFRCGECAGTFIPRGSFDAVIAAPQGSPEKAGALARLIAVLKSYI